MSRSLGQRDSLLPLIIMGNATTSLAYDIGEEILSEKSRLPSHWSMYKGSKKVPEFLKNILG